MSDGIRKVVLKQKRVWEIEKMQKRIDEFQVKMQKREFFHNSDEICTIRELEAKRDILEKIKEYAKDL